MVVSVGQHRWVNCWKGGLHLDECVRQVFDPTRMGFRTYHPAQAGRNLEVGPARESRAGSLMLCC